MADKEDKVSADEYDPDANPKGIVNLGTSENKLCEDVMLQKMKELTKSEDVIDKSVLYYYDLHGLHQLRNTLSGFIKDRFNPQGTVESDKLTVVDGVGACLNCLATALADEGDVFLSPTPCYPRIQTDMAEMAGVNIYQVPMFDDSCKDPSRLRFDVLESFLTKAKHEGYTVRGVVLISPHNPTGKVYSKEELQHLLEFCCRENLHLIVNEIFALSSQDDNTFTSVLSLNLPSPDKTHWTWGLSKDFGLSGYRCGVIYSHNSALNEYLEKIAYYSSIPAQIQTILEHMLSDKDWIDNNYRLLYHQRSKDAWKKVMEVLHELEIPTAYSGENVLFLWMDLSKFLKERTREAELELFHRFMDAGLYICPGTEMLCSVPGWFRLNYTTYRDHVTEGLTRFKAVLRLAGKTNNERNF